MNEDDVTAVTLTTAIVALGAHTLQVTGVDLGTAQKPLEWFLWAHSLIAVELLLLCSFRDDA